MCLCDSALEMAPVEKYTLCSQVAAMKPSSAPTSKKPVEMAGKSLGFFFLYTCLGDAGADFFKHLSDYLSSHVKLSSCFKTCTISLSYVSSAVCHVLSS